MWQTICAFDLLHSSHMSIQTILWCGKYSTTMLIGIISRFWICTRSRRLKINVRRDLMHFRESHIRANKLDVQETDFCFTQFYGSTHGWYPSSGSLEFGCRSVSFLPKPTQWNQRSIFTGKPCCLTPHQTSAQATKPKLQPSMRILNCAFECEIFSIQCCVVCFRGQWSRDSDDNQRQESDNETRVKNPQSCSWQDLPRS